MERLVEKTGQTQISYPDLTCRGYHDICRFEISVKNPISMKVLRPVQKLKHDALDSGRWYRMPCWLGMVMNDL